MIKRIERREREVLSECFTIMARGVRKITKKRGRKKVLWRWKIDEGGRGKGLIVRGVSNYGLL